MATPAPKMPLSAPSNSQAPPAKPPSLASLARSRVDQINCNQMPLVSSRIDIFRLEQDLASHPDRDFVVHLLSTPLTWPCLPFYVAANLHILGYTILGRISICLLTA